MGRGTFTAVGVISAADSGGAITASSAVANDGDVLRKQKRYPSADGALITKGETHSAGKTNGADNIADNDAEKAKENRRYGVVGSDNLLAALVAGVTTARGSRVTRVSGDGDRKSGESDGGEELELHLWLEGETERRDWWLINEAEYGSVDEELRRNRLAFIHLQGGLLRNHEDIIN
jgi:hypothetical protein